MESHKDEVTLWTKREDIKPLDVQTHHDGLGLNDLMTISADQRDPNGGNASHAYGIRMDISGTNYAIESGCTGMVSEPVAVMRFQQGPRGEEGSVPGITNEALVAIVIDRLQGFQDGPFRCRENALALTKLEEALLWMGHRARKRQKQGVLGKNEQHK